MLHVLKDIRAVILLGLLAVGIVLLATAPETEPGLQEAVATRVTVATVAVHDLDPVETVSGRLEPARRAALHFELSGQVAERAVEPGQAVAEDGLLLALEAGDFTDALAEAEAQLAQERRNVARDRELLRLARDNLRIQKDELARLEQLGAESLVSRSHLDEARSQVIRLESEVAQLKASTGSASSRIALREASRNRAARMLERATLSAPFAGTVNAVHVQQGDYVTPNQTVVDLIDAASLDLYVEVRGDVVAALAPGQAVDITVDGRTVSGTLFALQPDPDPVTFTHALRVRLPAGDLRPGQLATVRLPLAAQHGVVAVPVTAVLYEEGRTAVFRVNGERLEQVPVSIGYAVNGLRIITDGLAAGATVVVSGVAALSDGQRVSIAGGDSVVER